MHGRQRLELADVFCCYGTDYRQKHGASISMVQRRVRSRSAGLLFSAVIWSSVTTAAISATRITPARIVHCPKCESFARAQWLEDHQFELLDTRYFHLVFTLPEQIATIAYQNKRELYGILFRTAATRIKRRVERKCVERFMDDLLDNPIPGFDEV